MAIISVDNVWNKWQEYIHVSPYWIHMLSICITYIWLSIQSAYRSRVCKKILQSILETVITVHAFIYFRTISIPYSEDIWMIYSERSYGFHMAIISVDNVWNKWLEYIHVSPYRINMLSICITYIWLSIQSAYRSRVDKKILQSILETVRTVHAFIYFRAIWIPYSEDIWMIYYEHSYGFHMAIISVDNVWKKWLEYIHVSPYRIHMLSICITYI